MSSAAGTWEAKRTETIYLRTIKRTGASRLELIPQFDMAKEAAEELGILNIGLAGYEADDCIGTLTAMFSEEADITIVTGDKDLLQLLTVNVKVALLQKGIRQL